MCKNQGNCSSFVSPIRMFTFTVKLIRELAMKAKWQILMWALCISVAVCGQVRWVDGGLAEALEQARQLHRPVMLLCYETWCQHCKYTREQVMTDAAVGEFFNKNYICVAQDMDKDAGPEMNKSIKIHAFPTFVFYNETGEVIYRIEGEKKPSVLIAEGKNALVTERQFPSLKAQFEKDTTDGDHCYQYVSALHRGGVDCNAITDRYFATQTDKQLLSELNWRIFTNGVSDFESRMFRFVIGHQREYGRIVSQERIRRKMLYEVRELLTPLVEAGDSVGYLKKRPLALSIGLYSTNSLVFTYDVFLWGLNKNWSRYRTACLAGVEKYAWDNKTQLGDICTNFQKNITDPEATEKALAWTLRLLKLNTNYDHLMVCCELYARLGKTDDALQMAEKALALATKSGWDGVEARRKIEALKGK